MSALKLLSVPAPMNVDDTLFSNSYLDFKINKSRSSGWNGIITKLVNGKTVTLCCSSEHRDDIVTWATNKIRD